MDLSSGDSPFGGIPTRPMQIKVSYTFDDGNKTALLARLSGTVPVPAVAMDENTEVGVIELRQAVQAIMSASPEIMSKLGQGDFSVYAYDYTEYEAPLMGQGYLSSLLAASSPTPHAPAHQSRTMITGRVLRNMKPFGFGASETLEVKLRLVPVPKQVQNEYMQKMEAFRSGQNPALSAGFDANAWNASPQPSQQHEGQQVGYFDFQNTSASSAGSSGPQLGGDVFDFVAGGDEGGAVSNLQDVGMLQIPSDPTYGFNPAFAAHASHSLPGSRSGSPNLNRPAIHQNERLRHQSFSANTSEIANLPRPGSRASLRSEVQPSTMQRQASFQGLSRERPAETENYYEDSHSRKRAKVTQSVWRSRSSFGGNSGDLRITAATTASMHMHRPIAQRPTAPGSNLEPPPRVPTPLPHLTGSLPQARQRVGLKSLLRQASTNSLADSDFMSDVEQMSDMVMSSPDDGQSPERHSNEASPQEFSSSPPVFPGMRVQPSSPGLPQYPNSKNRDSGYMSEMNYMNSENVAGLIRFGDSDNEDRSPDAEDLAVAAQYQHRGQPSQQMQNPQLMQPDAYSDDFNNSQQQSTRSAQQLGEPRRLQGRSDRAAGFPSDALLDDIWSDRGRPNPHTAQAPSKFESGSRTGDAEPLTAQAPVPRPEPSARSSRRGSLALPPFRPSSVQSHRPQLTQSVIASQIPTTQASKRPKQTMQRSRTISGDSEAGSPAPSDNEGAAGPQRSGSGARRRKVIAERLKQSVEKGIIPTFCHHCGCVETPTWRKLWVKTCDGSPSGHESLEGDGETIGIEVVEREPVPNETVLDEDGNVVIQEGAVTKYRVLKSIKQKADRKDGAGAGFECVSLCNPCGLWFSKFRGMRPPDKWNRKPSSRARRKKLRQDIGMEGTSEAFYTDALGPEDNFQGQLPQDSIIQPPLPTNAAAPQYLHQQMQQPMQRQRANSMQPQQQRRPSAEDGQWNTSRLDAALLRAIQSSPARFQGTQQSPIELDDVTPEKSTRRLLFPSPRNEGETKSLDESDIPRSTSASPANADGDPLREKSGNDIFDKVGVDGAAGDFAIFKAFTVADKENSPPLLDADDDLAHLFEGSPTAFFKTPAGKTRSKSTPRSQRLLAGLLKTPTPASRKRNVLSPSLNGGNGATITAFAADDFMTSPAANSLHELLPSTPSRSGLSPARAASMTPFTAHLAQMLSSVNGNAAFSSPSRPFDFSDLPTFTTPGKTLDFALGGLDAEGVVSSDFGIYEDEPVVTGTGTASSHVDEQHETTPKHGDSGEAVDDAVPHA